MRATMADIARETGLTLGTVSRALNNSGKYSIAPETRKRVMDAAASLGYKPNLIGRALAAGSSGLILLLSPDPFSPYYAEFGRQLSLQAARHRYSLLNGASLQSTPREISSDDWLYGVDGIIVCDYDHRQQSYLKEAARMKIPVVGIGVRHPEEGDVVAIDLYQAACDLLSHLAEQGCRRIAIMADHGIGGIDQRANAYLDTLARLDMEPRIVVADGQSRAAGREAIQYADIAFDGLFCENDELAVGAYRGLLDRGVSIPGDVALAGCDGIDETAYQFTPITTLVQPADKICARAWEMLQKRLSGDDSPPQRESVSAVLAVRASTTRTATV